jgi:hypothetical protein
MMPNRAEADMHRLIGVRARIHRLRERIADLRAGGWPIADRVAALHDLERLERELEGLPRPGDSGGPS